MHDVNSVAFSPLSGRELDRLRVVARGAPRTFDELAVQACRHVFLRASACGLDAEASVGLAIIEGQLLLALAVTPATRPAQLHLKTALFRSWRDGAAPDERLVEILELSLETDGKRLARPTARARRDDRDRG